MSLFVDIHAIQNVAPSNLNRDLNGSPKTAIYGGVPRARVSSQSWKRPIRKSFATEFDAADLGMRTKRIAEVLATKISELDEALAEQAGEIAVEVFKATKINIAPPKKEKNADPIAYESGYLIFFSKRQLANAASLAVEKFNEGGLEAIASAKTELKNILRGNLSVDLALFGRMIANAQDLNVDASCQVAHAISTHEVRTEFDFFTAVDDAKEKSEDEDAGAAMMGTVEFNSSTLYRFATINASELSLQLGGAKAAAYAVKAFLKGFITTLPTGKQNTFAAQSLPAAIVVTLREGRPVSWADAFEKPIVAFDGSTAKPTGYLAESTKRLVDHRQQMATTYGDSSIAEFAAGVGEAATLLTNGGYTPISVPDLLSATESHITSFLSDRS